MLDVDVGSDSRNGNAGSNILAFWAKAVEWFTNEIVFSESDEKLREFVTLRFPSFLSNNHFETAAEHTTTDLDRVKVLKSLMQTWVKWFADVKEAEAFLAEGLVDDLMGGAPTARDLAQHYQQLSHLLNPSAQMKPPMLNDPKEQALWPFPEMAARPMKAAPNEARLPT